jgi:hypothetical protein
MFDQKMHELFEQSKTKSLEVFKVNINVGGFQFIDENIAIHKGLVKTSSNYLTFQYCKDLAGKIKEWHVSEYRDVLTLKDWKEMYQFGERCLQHMNDSGHILTPDKNRKMETAPCHNCGLLLPTESIQIDHHHAKSTQRSYAVLKVFRALGLTQNGPTGPKGGWLKNEFAVTRTGGTKPKIDPIHPKYRKLGDTGLDGTPSDESKRTLNEEGCLFLSVLAGCAYEAAGSRTASARFTKKPSVPMHLLTLRDYCVHSMVNLCPMCAGCNSRKSNKEKGKANTKKRKLNDVSS